tara:strand:- start:1726 stop:2070 length:345 start_codon:yes stop_codon:yes gene_type:complete
MSESIKKQTAIGSRLKWAREQAGLSQGQVAKMIDVHRPTISQIESGQRAVRADEVAQFADLYDVKDEWILRGDDVLESEHDPRVDLAARELRKLRKEDLETIVRLVRILRSNKE